MSIYLSSRWLIFPFANSHVLLSPPSEITEDEMVGWHHQLNGHEFEWTLGVADGQGGLMYCSHMGSQRVGHDWMTELNIIFNSRLFIWMLRQGTDSLLESSEQPLSLQISQFGTLGLWNFQRITVVLNDHICNNWLRQPLETRPSPNSWYGLYEHSKMIVVLC